MTEPRPSSETEVVERAPGLAAPDPPVLPESLAALGPNVIGATGGSGTRVVARIVRSAGMFIGTNLNASEDAVAFGRFSDRWINVFADAARTQVPEQTVDEMHRDLRELLRAHAAPIAAAPRLWGWKEPRSIFLLPFFHSAMPSLRYLHFVRDGRDMAYSSNQNQLSKHGSAVLGATGPAAVPIRSIRLWTQINLRAAEYGEKMLGDRYIRIRFEDLCFDPVPTVAHVLRFFGLQGDAEALARAEISPPNTFGRWQYEDEQTVAELHRIGGGALQKFGYLAAR